MTAADEAYLVGISNKGIYKRACKDLESEAVTATEIENGAAVTIGGSLMGVVGMLIFIPIVSVFYNLFRSSVYKRLRKKRQILREVEMRDRAGEEDPDGK